MPGTIYFLMIFHEPYLFDILFCVVLILYTTSNHFGNQENVQQYSLNHGVRANHGFRQSHFTHNYNPEPLSTTKPPSSALVVGEAGQRHQHPLLHPDLLALPHPIHPMYHFQNILPQILFPSYYSPAQNLISVILLFST